MRAWVEANMPAVCWLCCRPVLPGQRWDVDHAVPLSVAPELAYWPGNWRVAHASCNRSRGNRAPDQHRPAGNLVDPGTLSPRWRP